MAPPVMAKKEMQPAKPEAKPAFKDLLAQQSSEGFWHASALAMLQQFFSQKLPSHLPAQTLCTLAALCVLEMFFEANEGEWQLVAQKARAYLAKQGVEI
jgi:hypothetical protein